MWIYIVCGGWLLFSFIDYEEGLAKTLSKGKYHALHGACVGGEGGIDLSKKRVSLIVGW